MAVTLITHWWNEQLLTPFFIRHHLPLVDHAIVIDYASTDRSMDIVRELAPDWEIRQSRNSCFRASDCDQEVMDIERGVSGWKIALNATEFVCGDARQACDTLDAQGYAAAVVRGVAMVDMQERVNLDHDAELTDQCWYGYTDGPSIGYKSRLLHRHADGNYATGRHETYHNDVKVYADGLLCKWFGFAPWCQPLRDRKLAIQQQIPNDDRIAGRGFQHLIDEAQLNNMWSQEKAFAGDLRNNPDFF